MSTVLLGRLRPTPAEPVVAAAQNATALAWVALVAHDLGPSHDHEQLGDMAGWLVMVMAMMGPAVLPAVRHVVASSLRWRRPRAAAEFLSVYFAAWLLFGVVALSAARPLGRSVAAAGGVLAVAALWQLTPQKRRAIIDCHRAVPLPPTGRRATLGCVHFGAVHASACVRSCWPIMTVMAVAPGPHVLWSACLLPAVLHERLARRPRRAARATAAALAIAALLLGADVTMDAYAERADAAQAVVLRCHAGTMAVLFASRQAL